VDVLEVLQEEHDLNGDVDASAPSTHTENPMTMKMAVERAKVSTQGSISS
jgi:hypothetical protein